MSQDHPKISSEEVIQRLICENNQHANLMNEIRLMLCSEPEFDGMTMVGGVKSLLKRFREIKDKSFELEIKNKKLEYINRNIKTNE
jgi:hypothetical protein